MNFKNNLKRITIVYGLDNIDQKSMLINSIKSIENSNNFCEEIIVFLSSDNLKEIITNDINNIGFKNKFRFIVINNLENIDKAGMFFWLFSSYYTKTEYIIQLDNDTLINTDLSKMLPNKFRKAKTIYGVNIKFDSNYRVVKTISNDMNDLYNNFVNNEYVKKWINSGVVLINKDEFLKKYPKLEILNSDLLDYTNLSKYEFNFTPAVSDEGFLILKFYNSIGKIKRKFNLRIHSFNSTKRLLSKNDYIFHYNKSFTIDNNYVKLDIIEYINNYKYRMKFIDSLKSEFEFKNDVFLIKYEKILFKYITNDFKSIL